MPGSAQSITMTLGRSSLRQAHGFLAIAGFAGDIDIGFVFKNAAEATAHQAVIIHQQDGNFISGMRLSVPWERSGAPACRLPRDE